MKSGTSRTFGSGPSFGCEALAAPSGEAEREGTVEVAWDLVFGFGFGFGWFLDLIFGFGIVFYYIIIVFMVWFGSMFVCFVR